MESGSARYKLNEPKVVSETLDGETIAINLVTGSYYAINQSGSGIWELILAGHSIEQITQQADLRYQADLESIRAPIEDFIASLAKAELIAQTEGMEPEVPTEWSGPQEAFVAPSVEEYDDMQEMLLADPIHDVTESGWPNRK